MPPMSMVALGLDGLRMLFSHLIPLRWECCGQNPPWYFQYLAGSLIYIL